MVLRVIRIDEAGVRFSLGPQKQGVEDDYVFVGCRNSYCDATKIVEDDYVFVGSLFVQERSDWLQRDPVVAGGICAR